MYDGTKTTNQKSVKMPFISLIHPRSKPVAAASPASTSTTYVYTNSKLTFDDFY